MRPLLAVLAATVAAAAPTRLTALRLSVWSWSRLRPLLPAGAAS